MPEELPYQARVTLRKFLRRLRKTKGLTQQEAAQQAKLRPYKLGRVESGASTIGENDLRALLAVYGVTGEAQTEWVDRSSRSRTRAEDWAAKYSQYVGNEFRQFLAIEARTQVMRNFEPFLVPGLLQTQRYAEATLAVVIPAADTEADIGAEPDPQDAADVAAKRKALLDLRMERQRRWHEREDPAEAYFMVDESVLLRQVGGAEIMLEQLESLRAAVADGLDLYVLRHEAGLYEHWNEAYVIFESDLTLADHNLFRENPHSDEIMRESPNNLEPAAYLAVFDFLRESAPLETTQEVLDSLIATYERPASHSE